MTARLDDLSPCDPMEVRIAALEARIRELETQVCGWPFSFHASNQAGNLRDILLAVSSYYHIPVRALLGRCRDAGMVNKRFMLMGLARKLTLASSNKIGEEYKRDHGSVLHAAKVFQHTVETNASYRAAAETLEAELLKRWKRVPEVKA